MESKVPYQQAFIGSPKGRSVTPKNRLSAYDRLTGRLRSFDAASSGGEGLPVMISYTAQP